MWLWLHVEHPDRVASLVSRPTTSKSVPYKDSDRWAALMDPATPVDVVVPWFSSDSATIVRFATPHVDQVRALLASSQRVVDTGPGLVHVGEDGSCRLPPGGGSGVVACSTDRGLQAMGPWLAMQPRPEGEPADARLVVMPPPHDALKNDRSAQGMSGVRRPSVAIRADGGDVTTSAEAHIDWADSWWASVKQSAFATTPPAFARALPGASYVTVSSGDGPLEILLHDTEALGSFGQFMSKHSPAGLAGWETLRQRPWLAGRIIDVDEALPSVAALARARPGPAATKLAPAVHDACMPQGILAVSADFATVSALLHDTASAWSASTSFVFGAPAPGMGVPGQSVFVDELRRPSPSPPEPPRVLLVVGEGAVTWLFGGTSHARLGHLARRVLERAPGSAPDLVAGGNVVARSLASAAMLSVTRIDGHSELLTTLGWPDGSTPDAVVAAASEIERIFRRPPSFERAQISREADGSSALHVSADAETTRAMFADLGIPFFLLFSTLESWYLRPVLVIDKLF